MSDIIVAIITERCAQGTNSRADGCNAYCLSKIVEDK